MGNEFISYKNINKLIPGDSKPFINSLFSKEVIDCSECKIDWKSNSKYILIKLDTLIQLSPHLNPQIENINPTIYIKGFVFIKAEDAENFNPTIRSYIRSLNVFSIKPTEFSLINNEKHDIREWIILNNSLPIKANYKNNKKIYSELKNCSPVYGFKESDIIELIPKYVEFNHFVLGYAFAYGGENYPKLSEQIRDCGYSFNKNSKQSVEKTELINSKAENADDNYLDSLIIHFGRLTKKNNIRLIESTLLSMKKNGKYLTDKNATQKFQSFLIHNADDINPIHEIQGDSILMTDISAPLSVKRVMVSFRKQLKKIK